MDYRYGSHTVYKIQYQSVFATKYRHQVLKGDVGLKVREPIRQTCQAFEIEILKGVVSRDHVHLFVSAPPNRAPSETMRRIEGRSSTKRFESFPDLRKDTGDGILGPADIFVHFGRVDTKADLSKPTTLRARISSMIPIV